MPLRSSDRPPNTVANTPKRVSATSNALRSLIEWTTGNYELYARHGELVKVCMQRVQVCALQSRHQSACRHQEKFERTPPQVSFRIRHRFHYRDKHFSRSDRLHRAKLHRAEAVLHGPGYSKSRLATFAPSTNDGAGSTAVSSMLIASLRPPFQFLHARRENTEPLSYRQWSLA